MGIQTIFLCTSWEDNIKIGIQETDLRLDVAGSAVGSWKLNFDLYQVTEFIEQASNYYASFEAFTAMFQVEVYLVVTPCSIVVGYQRFRCLFCLHL
jgi:hypothetical protein